VLGMHRSGTSAVTRALNLLGLTVCPPADLIGAHATNPTGHWESRTLVECNNAVLLAAGARSWCPPPPGAGMHQHTAGTGSHPVVPGRIPGRPPQPAVGVEGPADLPDRRLPEETADNEPYFAAIRPSQP
jgi:hypothetical protein